MPAGVRTIYSRSPVTAPVGATASVATGARPYRGTWIGSVSRSVISLPASSIAV